jgi:hypothetical protein
MGDLLGSFPGCARVRPNCAGKTCVGLWGQSIVSMSSYRCYNRKHDQIYVKTDQVDAKAKSLYNSAIMKAAAGYKQNTRSE